MKPVPVDIHKATVTIQKLMADVNNSFLQIGAILYDIRENNRWKGYGDHVKSFNDYLKEVHVARSTGFFCIAIYEKFGSVLSERKVPIGFERLQKALPLVKTQEDAEDWIAKAESMPIDGYDDAIREAKGMPTRDSCAHAEVEMWCKCLKCGKFLKDAPMVDAAAEA